MPAKLIRAIAGLVLNNKGTKLVALVLALVVWFTIREVISFEREIADVPIEIALPDGWAVLDRSENAVQVTFRGTKSAVLDMDPKLVKVVIPIEGEQQLDSMFVQMSTKQIEAPGGVRAVKLEPDSMILSIDREESLEIPVRPAIQGTLPDGYEVGTVVSSPPKVTLYGPSRRLRETEFVPTTAIDLAGRLQSFKLSKTIQPPSESWVARVEPESVSVEVEIIERSSVREFADLPVHLLVRPGADPDFVLSSNRVVVILEGRAEVLEALADDAVQVYVSVGGFAENETNLVPVQVNAPLGTILKLVTPDAIVVDRRAATSPRAS